jgi:integrase
MASSTAAAPRRKAVFVIAKGTPDEREIPRPHAGFVLCPTTNGYWQKKTAGKIRYYGRWSAGKDEHGRLIPLPDFGWREAEANYNRTVADALSGKAPADREAVVTVGGLCSWFLNSTLKRLGLTEDEIAPLVKAKPDEWRKVWWAAIKGRRGENMSPRQAMEYRGVCDVMVKRLGKSKPVGEIKPDDFAELRREFAKTYGVARLGNMVAWVRCVFNRAAENDVIDHAPKFGDGFAKPKKAAVLLERAERGERYFTPEECRKLIDAADPIMRSMILLAVNAGYGPTDLGELPRSGVDLTGGWIAFRRGKTGQPRLAKLWPETITALKVAYAARPVPDKAEHADLVFLTKFGNPFAGDGFNTISAKFAKLLEQVGLDDRAGRALYSLRHVHRSHSENAGDLSASRFIMGHANGHVENVYIKRTPETDARVAKVCEFVRTKLLGEGGDR